MYGKKKQYYETVKKLIPRIVRFYPGWIVRIHHDNTIDQSFRCEIECQINEQTSEMYDLVDFCNVESLPSDLSRSWNANFMQKMSWRWLPIGDPFVDLMASRDTDAWIHQRELDSVHVWLNSSTLFHVMKGSLQH